MGMQMGECIRFHLDFTFTALFSGSLIILARILTLPHMNWHRQEPGASLQDPFAFASITPAKPATCERNGQVLLSNQMRFCQTSTPWDRAVSTSESWPLKTFPRHRFGGHNTLHGPATLLSLLSNEFAFSPDGAINIWALVTRVYFLWSQWRVQGISLITLISLTITATLSAPVLSGNCKLVFTPFLSTLTLVSSLLSHWPEWEEWKLT